jgi:hypothetical protein
MRQLIFPRVDQRRTVCGGRAFHAWCSLRKRIRACILWSALVLTCAILNPGNASAAAPAPSGAQITFVKLSSPVGGTQPFTVGVGLKKGDIAGTPTLNIPNSQVMVMRRWNDGSVKHAIASGHADLAAGTALAVGVYNAAAAATGTNLTAADIQAANPQASISFGSYGTVNLSSLLAAPFRTFISGPEMVEAHYVAPVGADSSLVAWFHVRLYKSGKVWVRAVGTNGYLDVAAASKSYLPAVGIGGAQIWNNGGAALTHYAHTRWTQDGWIGGDPQITPQHDTAYLKAARLVPNYMLNTPGAATLSGLYQDYAPNQNGNWTATMGNTGYQPQIGLLPVWDALYITSNADSRAYKSVIANAKALNSYPIVWNDSLTKLPVKPSNRPGWSVAGSSGSGDTSWSAGGLTWENAHHGSGGYLAYLITGDYYHLETMQEQTALGYLMAGATNYDAVPPGPNLGTSRYYNSQTRAYAWAVRTLSQYVGIAPSADTLLTDYAALLANNMTHLKSIKDAVVPAGIGYIYEYDSNLYGVGLVAPWQQHFFIQSLGMGSDLEPLSGMAAYYEVRDYMYRAAVGILGDGTGYCFTEAGEYNIQSSTGTGGGPNSWYKTWAQVYAGTFTIPPPCGNTLHGGSGGDPAQASGGYWGNLMPAIAYAADHGAAGAAASWARLTDASNWSSVLNSGFDNTPVWGVIPRGTVTLPGAPTVTLSASPASITAGSSSTLAWNTTNTTACTASGGWSGTLATSGRQVVSPASSTTYTLACTGTNGSATQSTTVTVSGVAPAPTVAISVAPASVVAGASATLIWSSTNAASCTASNGWAGAKATSGTQSVSPTVNTTYTLVCTGANGTTAPQSATVSVSSTAPSAIPAALGWYQIPNSKLHAVCPPNNFGGSGYAFSDFCPGMVYAWNSAVMDTKRNRLIVWGGGHNDYYGNELYAVNLNDLSIQRLNDPGLPIQSTVTGYGQPAIANGTQANSRHTYDGIAYMANLDKMFVQGGAPAGAFGGITNDTWTFDFATMQWQRMAPTGSIPAAVPGIVTAYDPNSGKIFVHDDANLYAYDYATDNYQLLAVNNAIDYHLTAVIDPVRKKYVMIGGGQAWVYSIAPGSTYTRQALATTGGSTIINSAYPGLAYDPVSDRIVAWHGGDTVYSLNLDTNVWTPSTIAGGPGAPQVNGTIKRWSYSPASGVFVLVNDVDQNAYTFRLSPPGPRRGTPPNLRVVD